MWFFHSKRLSNKEVDAISKISYMIKILEVKKKKWKSFYPYYIPKSDAFAFMPLNISSEEKSLRYNQEKYMADAKNICLKISSIFINYLVTSLKYLKKKKKEDLKYSLNEILQLLKHELSEAISSQLIKDLKKAHEMDYKMFLKRVKNYKKLLELAEKRDPAYISWLHKLGIRPETQEELEEHIELAIEEYKRSISLKNYEKYSGFRKDLKELLEFKNFLEINIMAEFKLIIDNLS